MTVEEAELDESVRRLLLLENFSEPEEEIRWLAEEASVKQERETRWLAKAARVKQERKGRQSSRAHAAIALSRDNRQELMSPLPYQESFWNHQHLHLCTRRVQLGGVLQVCKRLAWVDGV
jgi:hypothetical protein